jgi:hypothetical protein
VVQISGFARNLNHFPLFFASEASKKLPFRVIKNISAFRLLLKYDFDLH